jgi:hypothetical protein
MKDSTGLIYGETMVGREMARCLEAVSDLGGQSQLDVAGRLVVAGFDLLDQLCWDNISQLSLTTYRVFGERPDGRRGADTLIPWNITTEEWGRYLVWCSKYPVNIRGIVDSAFKEALAVDLEKQGTDFARDLKIEPYTAYQHQTDTDLYWYSHGGIGSCLDRGPNW